MPDIIIMYSVINTKNIYCYLYDALDYTVAFVVSKISSSDRYLLAIYMLPKSVLSTYI